MRAGLRRKRMSSRFHTMSAVRASWPRRDMLAPPLAHPGAHERVLLGALGADLVAGEVQEDVVEAGLVDADRAHAGAGGLHDLWHGGLAVGHPEDEAPPPRLPPEPRPGQGGGGPGVGG